MQMPVTVGCCSGRGGCGGGFCYCLSCGEAGVGGSNINIFVMLNLCYRTLWSFLL